MATEEAAHLGSPEIEAEHLVLGISRSCEPELKALLKLKEVEESIRADPAASALFESSEESSDMPLSRILTYAAEEAVRLGSRWIGSGHLLLGVLRESRSIASRFFVAHNVDLQSARQIVANTPTRGDTGKFPGSIRLVGGAVAQLATLVLLGVAVASSTFTGRHLLLIAAIWLLAVLAWLKLAPSSFGVSLGKRNRAKIAVIYAFAWLYQVFVLGWLLPLVLGIYRVTVR